MATFRKRGKTWEVQVAKLGVRKSATFFTKAEAQSWAATQEADIIAGKTGTVPDKTFGDLLDRYATDVTPTKAGAKWEATRINLFKRDPIAQIHLKKIGQPDFAAWRDRRLKSVSAASVRREWNILSNACRRAVDEWKWLTESPIKGVTKPEAPDARDRLITSAEIEAMKFQFGGDLNTITGRVGQVFAFALETAMRCGEICALTWAVIDLNRCILKVQSGKTRAARRDVPLSAEAVRILTQFTHRPGVFEVNEGQVDSLFRKAKKNALVSGFHFHDARANALTMLSKKLDILALARTVGHKDLKMLQVYYRESAEDLAKLL